MWFKSQSSRKLANLSYFYDIPLGLDDNDIGVTARHNFNAGMALPAWRHGVQGTGSSGFFTGRDNRLYRLAVPRHGEKKRRRPFADSVYAGEQKSVGDISFCQDPG
jgi:hypothetical protein